MNVAERYSKNQNHWIHWDSSIGNFMICFCPISVFFFLVHFHRSREHKNHHNEKHNEVNAFLFQSNTVFVNIAFSMEKFFSSFFWLFKCIELHENMGFSFKWTRTFYFKMFFFFRWRNQENVFCYICLAVAGHNIFYALSNGILFYECQNKKIAWIFPHRKVKDTLFLYFNSLVVT